MTTGTLITLRRPMREIAARYPITYRKVGEKMAARGFNLQGEVSKAETYQLMLGILAEMARAFLTAPWVTAHLLG